MAPYQVFTSQNYPYIQKHSGVPVPEIATLKRAFSSSLWGVDDGVNPLGEIQLHRQLIRCSWYPGVIIRVFGFGQPFPTQCEVLQNTYRLLKKTIATLLPMKYNPCELICHLWTRFRWRNSARALPASDRITAKGPEQCFAVISTGMQWCPGHCPGSLSSTALWFSHCFRERLIYGRFQSSPLIHCLI